MQSTLKYVKANTSKKNGKTYVELFNPNNFCKTIHEMTGDSTVNGLNSGNDVIVTFELSGEGFKQYLNVTQINKK